MSDTEEKKPEEEVQEVPLDDEDEEEAGINAAPAAEDVEEEEEKKEEAAVTAPDADEAEAAEAEAPKEEKKKEDVFGGGDDDELFGGEEDEEEEEEAAPAPKKEEAKPASDPLSSAPAPSTEAKPKAKPAAAAAAEPEKKKEKAPAAAAEPAKAKARRKSSSGEEPGNGKSSFLEVAVSKPSKIGDGMSSYMVYHVHTKTNLPSFSMSDVEVQHRFSDFFSLYKYLVESYPGVIVPPCPPKDALGTGMMKFKSSGEEITPFVERRAGGLERFMQRVAAHPVLRKDDLLKTFLTTENKMPKPKSSTLANIAAKLTSFVESDEWYADKAQEIDALEGQLKKLHTALETLVKRRKDLSGHTTLFAESFGALADAEEIESLQKAMHQMADVEVKVARLHSKQENRDFYSLSEIAFDYLQMIQAVKTCFQQRMAAFRAWQNAESALVKKKEAEANYTAKNRVEKLDQAAREVAEAEEHVTQTHEAFDKLSARLKKELKRFEIVRAHDFTHAMVEYVESMMTLQHQVVKAWEAFLPEAKSIGQ